MCLLIYIQHKNSKKSPESRVVVQRMTVFVLSVREYWQTVDLRLVKPSSLPSDLTGEEANLTDRPALDEGVSKM